MARKVEVRLIDDLDQGPADETVTFALDAVEYTIDLSTKNAKKLRDELARYVDNATRVGRTQHRGAAPAARPRRARDERNGRIRIWAAERGLQVAPHGRIKQEIIDQYEAAMREPPTAPPTAASAGRRRRRTRPARVVVSTAE